MGDMRADPELVRLADRDGDGQLSNRELFNLADQNHDGDITRDEFQDTFPTSMETGSVLSPRTAELKRTRSATIGAPSTSPGQPALVRPISTLDPALHQVPKQVLSSHTFCMTWGFRIVRMLGGGNRFHSDSSYSCTGVARSLRQSRKVEPQGR